MHVLKQIHEKFQLRPNSFNVLMQKSTNTIILSNSHGKDQIKFFNKIVTYKSQKL